MSDINVDRASDGLPGPASGDLLGLASGGLSCATSGRIGPFTDLAGRQSLL